MFFRLGGASLLPACTAPCIGSWSRKTCTISYRHAQIPFLVTLVTLVTGWPWQMASYSWLSSYGDRWQMQWEAFAPQSVLVEFFAFLASQPSSWCWQHQSWRIYLRTQDVETAINGCLLCRVRANELIMRPIQRIVLLHTGLQCTQTSLPSFPLTIPSWNCSDPRGNQKAHASHDVAERLHGLHALYALLATSSNGSPSWFAAIWSDPRQYEVSSCNQFWLMCTSLCPWIPCVLRVGRSMIVAHVVPQFQRRWTCLNRLSNQSKYTVDISGLYIHDLALIFQTCLAFIYIYIYMISLQNLWIIFRLCSRMSQHVDISAAPQRASKPCHGLGPQWVAEGPRSLDPLWCNTSASSLVTRPCNKNEECREGCEEMWSFHDLSMNSSKTLLVHCLFTAFN